MKKRNRFSVIFSLMAIACFVASIIAFVDFDVSGSVGTVFLCAGGVLLCIGSALAMKGKKEDTERKDGK